MTSSLWCVLLRKGVFTVIPLSFPSKDTFWGLHRVCWVWGVPDLPQAAALPRPGLQTRAVALGWAHLRGTPATARAGPEAPAVRSLAQGVDVPHRGGSGRAELNQ